MLACVVGAFIAIELIIQVVLQIEGLGVPSWVSLGLPMLIGLGCIVASGTRRSTAPVGWRVWLLPANDIVFFWGAVFLTGIAQRADAAFYLWEAAITAVLIMVYLWLGTFGRQQDPN